MIAMSSACVGRARPKLANVNGNSLPIDLRLWICKRISKNISTIIVFYNLSILPSTLYLFPNLIRSNLPFITWKVTIRSKIILCIIFSYLENSEKTHFCTIQSFFSKFRDLQVPILNCQTRGAKLYLFCNV